MKEFNGEYASEPCEKCNGHAGYFLEYNVPTDRLIVKCKRCGHSYNMEPKKKAVGKERKQAMKERKGWCD